MCVCVLYIYTCINCEEQKFKSTKTTERPCLKKHKYYKLSVVVCACQPSSQESEAGRSGVPGYKRPCIKKSKTETESKAKHSSLGWEKEILGPLCCPGVSTQFPSILVGKGPTKLPLVVRTIKHVLSADEAKKEG